jgi:hypothetical protein
MVRPVKPNTERTTEHPYRGVFVFVRRTPPNNVRKCSVFANNVRQARRGEPAAPNALPRSRRGMGVSLQISNRPPEPHGQSFREFLP